ncbi:unnamed protein product, partial [Rotaria sp. Silwood2]
DIPEDQIKQVEREYRNHTPIWWYTAETFMYPMLNRGLRQMDVDIILKMGFFIRHLHNHITQLHQEQQGSMPTKFQVFRGQGLSMEDFEKMKKTEGGLMSFNNFLSTSHKRTISLDNFVRPATNNPSSVGILFVMNIDTAICMKSSTPFAEVSKVSFFEGKEEEIFFSTHTIFLINRIERIPDEHTDRLWQVNLTLAGNQDDDFSKLTAHLRVEVNLKAPTRGVPQLAFVLLKLGEPAKAKKLYKILLAKASSDIDRADYNHKLGWAYDVMGKHSKALSSYKRSLKIRKIALPPNHPDLAYSYNGIGNVYDNMDKYSKALSSYKRSLETRKIALPPNHPDFAQSYNNIGLVYSKMNEYSKALSSYEKALDIDRKALPPNHPDLASDYNNIGSVYDNMGEYSKALSSYERSLEIWKIALPSNHPDLAASYLNIGTVYAEKGEYSKALSSYERSLEIRKIALPPNHPDLAASYLNIGNVYKDMGEYSKALTYYEKAQEIFEKSLPPTHPHIALVKTSIENVKKKM